MTAPPGVLPPLDDAALRHVAKLLDELCGLVQVARASGPAARIGRIEDALAQARAVSATLSTALIGARDRSAIPPD
ncbi:hypothetical protein ACFO1B_40525 [Dactylosporangium siamense]|uniref:Uncharacterized protein n=1 Tax=Dactylosporangium siamense TaxID=685454 RepID=A0A919UEL6_9ACTN|nr:hypothetical protein [Dactylosporangium siamense]GIG52584.1 hypothetical protein Dsi01nite_106250 [Dactylosporangium siamense]